MTRRIVTLTTDFGLKDPYAGQMKGALLTLAPEVEVVDLTHEVGPQDVLEGAFLLETSWRYFPEGSIHVAVVDPGVGTHRRRLAVSTGGHFFVGPDNGVLSGALPETSRPLREPTAGYRTSVVTLPPGVTAFAVERLESLGGAPSPTFEGRDVFAPVAALLAGGASPHDFGPASATMLAFPAIRAPVRDGEVFGLVLRSDHFGNLVTDIRGRDVFPGSLVKIGGRSLPLARTYADAEDLCAIVGSSGYLEIAMPKGNATEVLAAGKGAPVVCVTHAGRL